MHFPKSHYHCFLSTTKQHGQWIRDEFSSVFILLSMKCQHEEALIRFVASLTTLLHIMMEMDCGANRVLHMALNEHADLNSRYGLIA